MRHLQRAAACVLLISATSACDDGGSEPSDAPDAMGDVIEDAPVVTPPTFCTAPAPPVGANGVALESVFAHAFPEEDDATRITALVESPLAEGEWYAVKHKGWIIRFDESGDVAGHTIAMDLRDGRVSVDNDEAGIVSLAFHPSGEHIFLGYQAPSQSGAFFDSVISRFDVNADGTFDADSEVEFIRLPQPEFPHSLTHVAFGPDGYLYATFGDGGGSVSRPNGQDFTNLYSTMIRIDVDREDTERGTPYAIPPNNPDIAEDAAPEIFAYGLRNTWRFSFDSLTGTIWGGDVGESRIEEVNRIEAGQNYGWPIMEGDGCFEAETCDTAGITPPIVSYSHSDGISVTGGFVYRGNDIPALQGRYVYADYISGKIWSIDAENPGEPRLELEAGFWIVSMTEAADGELYLVRWSQARHFDSTGPGGLYRFAPAEPSPAEDAFPTRFSETGCADPDDVTQPASGLRLYTPAAALWSDGADKTRYLSLPFEGEVTLDEDGNLQFPEGTVLVKHFLFDDRYVETRLYIRHAGGVWRGYTYRWREDQSDADLLDDGVDELLPNGVLWRYPSRTECANCHTPAASILLGLEAAQLHGDGTLESWLQEGLFAPEVTQADFDAFAPLQGLDSDADVATRARSYLHSNCAGCHRPGGPPQTELDLRYNIALADMNLCNARPINGTVGADDPDAQRLLTPGDTDHSILYHRLTDSGPFRMPPLATEVVHTEAADVIEAWISGMTACDTAE